MSRTLTLIVVLTLSLLVAPLAPKAQPRGHIPLVGMLRPGDSAADADPKSYFNAFRQGLRRAWLRGGPDHPPGGALRRVAVGPATSLAAELVQLNPDVLVIATTPGALGGQAGNHDHSHCSRGLGGNLVAEGIVASLAQPGGNVRGRTTECRVRGQTLRAAEGSRADAHACGRPRSCG